MEDRRRGLRAAVSVLADADATVVENAVELVAGLRGFGRCDDREATRPGEDNAATPPQPETSV
ncbi:MAG: hypothetical protein AAGF11_41580 [Myxococcota bacterium]